MCRSRWVQASVVLLCLGACSGEEPSRTAANHAALSGGFDALICTLGAECARWGELIDSASISATPCSLDEAEPRAVQWHQPIDQVACPLGTCPAIGVQLAIEPAGTALAMLTLEQPTPMVRGRSAGLWLARYQRDGELAGSTIWDFAIPPPGVEVRRNALLLSDESGEVVLASARAILPGDAPRPLELAKMGGRNSPKPRSANVQTPASRPYGAALGRNDELLVLSSHAIDEFQSRPVLTLHDRRGRVLWNRPWLDGDASVSISEVHVARDGAITVLVAASEGPLEGVAIARLDRAGRVLWQRRVANWGDSVQSEVDEEGNVFVLSTAWLDQLETRLERIDSEGQSTGSWSLVSGFWAELHSGQGRVLISDRTDIGFGSELWLWSFDARTDAIAACQPRRYAWPGSVDSLISSEAAAVENGHAEVFLATTQQILMIEGGAP